MHGSRKLFDNQLKSKALELYEFYIQNACRERNSDVLKVNCCTSYCDDCDWVKNCDQHHQHHGESYSKSSIQVEPHMKQLSFRTDYGNIEF